MDEELRLAAKSFFEDDEACAVMTSKQQVKLSMILKWYYVDFASNDKEVSRWEARVRKYLLWTVWMREDLGVGIVEYSRYCFSI